MKKNYRLNKTSGNIYKVICIAILGLVLGCDFSARINKEIILAQTAFNNQNYKRAAFIYEQILKRNPPIQVKTKIHYQLGDLYSLHLGLWDKSIVHFKEIIAKANIPLWKVKAEEKLGEIYFSHTKDFNASAEIYRELSEFVPKLMGQDFYELRLGVSLLYANKFTRSESVFNNIRSNVGHTYYIRSKYFLGLNYFHQKLWKGAIVEWKTYIIEEKRSDYVVQTKFLLANTYESTEDLKKAYNIYYNILNEYPNPQVIKNRLKSLYSRRVARKR
ncbi:MAG: tetratricopeptide repeat protein [Bacteriovoracaceae bacterium]|jgi:tetratricopeptide (TPR) repeat protein|nr:tetratricopeptide repeat protein [Bacteriovoracaceae bacterium]